MVQLALCTWPEVEAYLRDCRGIVVPIGATEQHGPNGPIGTDHLDAECIARAMAEETGAMVAPTLAYGMSQHHLAFAGSVTLRPATLMRVVEDVVLSLARHGFARFLFINGHGGNIAPLQTAFDEIHAARSLGADRPPLRLRQTMWAGARTRALVRELYGDAEGSHATASEISLAWHYRPESVRQVEMQPRQANRRSGFHDAEDYRRRYPDGRIGSDPSLSAPEHGARLLAAAASDMAEAWRALLAD